MVVLRATRKLQKLLPIETDGELQSDGALGDWYVNRFVVDRRPLLMIVSSASLLAAIEPARDIRALPERLGTIVAARLYWLGVDQRVIDAEVSTMQPVRLAATRDRSVMGIVVECCKDAAYHLPVNGWNDASLVEVESFLRQTPWHASKRDFVVPQKKAVELLNARWGKYHEAVMDKFDSVFNALAK
jgi:hypothetical protein